MKNLVCILYVLFFSVLLGCPFIQNNTDQGIKAPKENEGKKRRELVELFERTKHQALVFKNKMWIIGGIGAYDFLGLGNLNDVLSSTDGKTWKVEKAFVDVITNPNNPGYTNEHFSARYESQALVFDNKLWVIGGRNGDGSVNDVWSSEDGKTWTEVTPEDKDKAVKAGELFSARDEHQAVVFKDPADKQEKMWVIGGDIRNIGFANDVWKSSDGKTWKEVIPNNNSKNIKKTNEDIKKDAVQSRTWFASRLGHQALAFKDPVDNTEKMWVIGGKFNQGSGLSWREMYINDVWKSADGITWEEVTPQSDKDRKAAETANTLFSPRDGHQALVFSNKMWVIGGAGGDEIWSSADGATWSKETTSSITSDAKQFTFPKHSGHQALVFDNKMWIIGGSNYTEWYFDRKWVLRGLINAVWSSVNGKEWTPHCRGGYFKQGGNPKGKLVPGICGETATPAP